MDPIVSIILLMIINNQVSCFESVDERKPRFNFGVYEMLHKQFCKNICNMPYPTNRSSRTISLCLIKCARPQISTNKPNFNRPPASVTISIHHAMSSISSTSAATTPSPNIIVGTTKGIVQVIPVDLTPSPLQRVEFDETDRKQSLPSILSSSLYPVTGSIGDGDRQFSQQFPTSWSAWNISVPISVEALVLGKARDNHPGVE